jgi:hypothetical protein
MALANSIRIQNPDSTDHSLFPYPFSTTPKVQKDFIKHVDDFAKSGLGYSRITQLVRKICEVATFALKEFGNSTYVFFEKVAATLGAGWAVFTVPRLWDAGRQAVDLKWSAPLPETEAQASRRHWENVNKTADFVEACSGAFKLFDIITPIFGPAASGVINVVGDAAGLVSGVSDTKMTVEDMNLAWTALDLQMDGEDKDVEAAKRRFSNTLTLGFIKTVKNISSMVSGIFGLLSVAFASIALPTAVSLSLGLISVSSGITAHFYKVTSLDQPVDFYKTPESGMI